MSEPLVSICMPVYNGVATLNATLESILNSEYRNIEILITDDCSTDSTPELCKEWVSRDSRISYHPVKKNSGAVANFNRSFHLAKGKYFTWVAQDDLRHSSYIRKCVQKLEENDSAVLCQSWIAVVIDHIDNVSHYIRISPLVRLYSPVRRFLAAYRKGEEIGCIAFYALIRTDAARKTRLWQNYLGSDIAFFNELSLYGEFLEIPETLFWYFGREKVRTPSKHYQFLNPDNRYSRFYFPFAVMAWNQVISLMRSPLGIWEKSVGLIGLLAIEFFSIFRKIIFFLAKIILGKALAVQFFKIMHLKAPIRLQT